MVARYKIIRATFVLQDGHLEASFCEPGQEIDFSDVPNTSMQPINEEARAAKANAFNPPTGLAASILPRYFSEN
jgi:hypothetical protein